MKKKPSGRPFKRQTEDRLTCGWCLGTQNKDIVDKLFRGKQRIAYRCDCCQRGLQIKKSADGFYSAYQTDRARYYRNVEKGVNRLKPIIN